MDCDDHDAEVESFFHSRSSPVPFSGQIDWPELNLVRQITDSIPSDWQSYTIFQDFFEETPDTVTTTYISWPKHIDFENLIRLCHYSNLYPVKRVVYNISDEATHINRYQNVPLFEALAAILKFLIKYNPLVKQGHADFSARPRFSNPLFLVHENSFDARFYYSPSEEISCSITVSFRLDFPQNLFIPSVESRQKYQNFDDIHRRPSPLVISVQRNFISAYQSDLPSPRSPFADQLRLRSKSPSLDDLSFDSNMNFNFSFSALPSTPAFSDQRASLAIEEVISEDDADMSQAHSVPSSPLDSDMSHEDEITVQPTVPQPVMPQPTVLPLPIPMIPATQLLAPISPSTTSSAPSASPSSPSSETTSDSDVDEKASTLFNSLEVTPPKKKGRSKRLLDIDPSKYIDDSLVQKAVLLRVRQLHHQWKQAWEALRDECRGNTRMMESHIALERKIRRHETLYKCAKKVWPLKMTWVKDDRCQEKKITKKAPTTEHILAYKVLLDERSLHGNVARHAAVYVYCDEVIKKACRDKKIGFDFAVGRFHSL